MSQKQVDAVDPQLVLAGLDQIGVGDAGAQDVDDPLYSAFRFRPRAPIEQVVGEHDLAGRRRRCGAAREDEHEVAGRVRLDCHLGRATSADGGDAPWPARP